jgi:restriction endonuclease Mrr
MAIPDYQTVMLPLLRFAADGQEHSLREAIEKLADHFGLSDEERKALLPSGRPRVKSTFYRRTLLACVLTRRSFAMGFTPSQNPSRSPTSPSQAAVLMAG